MTELIVLGTAGGDLLVVVATGSDDLAGQFAAQRDGLTQRVLDQVGSQVVRDGPAQLGGYAVADREPAHPRNRVIRQLPRRSPRSTPAGSVLRREEGRRFSQELVIQPELGILPA